MKQTSLFLAFCLISFLFSYGIPNSYAEFQTIQINPSETKYLSVFLNQGDTIQYSMSISGGSGNDVNFVIQDPDSNTLMKIRVSGSYNGELTSNTSGNYQFSFGNTFSILSSKQVQFTYSITSPASSNQIATNNAIVGFVFLIVIIVIPITVGIYVYKRRKRKSVKPTFDDTTKYDEELRKHNTKALDILKNRLAKGEITKDEFDKLSKEFE